ncbi:hypothetical protein TYRP_006724 [Tyrophagus putrescentiae]|nr:hypothetical protein TYRP_006724 [Tyrophagus putrescentiae]
MKSGASGGGGGGGGEEPSLSFPSGTVFPNLCVHCPECCKLHRLLTREQPGHLLSCRLVAVVGYCLTTVR